MLQYDIFKRQFIVKRVSDLTKIHDIDELKQLPTGCILHIYDNLNINKDVDQINVCPHETNKLLDLDPPRSYVFNVTHPYRENILEYDESIKHISIGIDRQLRKFKQEHIAQYKFVGSSNELIERSDISCLINYNPLVTTRIRGINKQLKQIDFLLSNIINVLSDVPDRKHFVNFELTTLTFQKTDFIKTFKKIDRTTLKYQEVAHYLLLVHFYSFIESHAMTSLLEYIPENMLENIHIFFTVKNKFIVYNLKILKDLNGESNAILQKLINHINMLCTSGVDKHVFKVEQVVEDNVIKVEEEPEVPNAPMFKKPIEPKKALEFQKQHVEEIDQMTEKVLEENTSLTKAQRNYVEKISKAYKTVKIGNQTIEEVLNEEPGTISDNKIDKLEKSLIDKSMTKSSINKFDAEYIKKQMKKDLVMTLLEFNKQGMFLTNIEEAPKIDNLNRLMEYKVTFEDINHKKHTIKFQLPIVDENGVCYVNGVEKMLRKQRINVPICKTGPRRVTLNSNYNKALVERIHTVAHSFIGYVGKVLKTTKVSNKVVYGLNNYNDIKLPYEYSTLAKKYVTIKIKDTEFIFDYKNRTTDEKILKFEKDNKCVFVGKSKNEKYYLKIDGTLLIENKNEVVKSTFIDLICEIAEVSPTNLSEWTELQILNKRIPVIFTLCYKYGLTHMLEYTNTDYKLYDKNERVDIKKSDLVIQFLDKKLIISRVPLTNYLLFAGLNNFKLNETPYEDMDDPNVYYDLIQTKKLSVNYIKGIESFFDLFVDPITKDVLFQMGEPTTFKDLLIRATALLSTEDHPPPASSANFRFRTYERFPAVVYNTLARAYSTYKYKALGAKNKFSINEYELQKKILQDPLLQNISVNNPITDLRQQTVYSHLGSGGRSADTLMIEDRQFTQDNIGIMSEASTDSGDTAVTAHLSVDPSIANLRGLTVKKNVDEIEPTQLLSIGSLLMPGATNADK